MKVFLIGAAVIAAALLLAAALVPDLAHSGVLCEADTLRTTRVQPPNMKGKKTYAFRCGCCWARDCREHERRKVDLREAAMELVDPTTNDEWHYITINDVDYYI